MSEGAAHLQHKTSFEKLIADCDTELQWLLAIDASKPADPYGQIQAIKDHVLPLANLAVRIGDTEPPVLPASIHALTLPRGSALTTAIAMVKRLKKWANETIANDLANLRAKLVAAQDAIGETKLPATNVSGLSPPRKYADIAAAIGTRATEAMAEMRKLVTQLRGTDPGEEVEPAVLDIFAREYGWTTKQFAGMTDFQILMYLRQINATHAVQNPNASSAPSAPVANAMSSSKESLRTPQQLLEAFGKAAARFPDCPRMLAFLNSAREDGLMTVPPSFIPRRPDGQPVVGKLNVGGEAKTVLGHNATFYGIGGARAASESGNVNVGFVLYGASNDEAVKKFRELGSEAGVVVHIHDMLPGIQNYDRPLVLWTLIVYRTLQGSTWLSQIDGVAENPASHFNPFAASAETLKRLLAINAVQVQAREAPADVPLDQSTMAAGKGMAAHLDSLAASNTVMREVVVNLGTKHAVSLQPGIGMTGNAGNQIDDAMMAVQIAPVSCAIALPAIINAIHELHRTIEFPPGKDWQPPGWLVERHKGEDVLLANLKNEPQLHYWLFQEARNELLKLLSANNDSPHRDTNCPEITEAKLDQKKKVALLDLRKRLKKSFPGDIIYNGAERLQMLDYLESVLKLLGNDESPEKVARRKPNAGRDEWIKTYPGGGPATKRKLDEMIATTHSHWKTVSVKRINAIKRK